MQRFYPALPQLIGVLPDFGITAEIAARLGLTLENTVAARAFLRLAEKTPAYAGLTYQELAEVTEQWPIIGRDDVYYGGTTYDNRQGLGVQLASAADRGESPALMFSQLGEVEKPEGLQAVPVTHLYDRGGTVTPSKVLASRLRQPYIVLNPHDAEKLGVEFGRKVSVGLNGAAYTATADIDNSLPAGAVLVPRSMGIPISGPTPAIVKAA